MFRILIYPSSGACDCVVELPRWSYCSWFDVCWSFGVVGLEWYPCCKLKLCVNLLHGYHASPATPKLQHTSNQEHATNVVIQQNSRKLLMMDILMPETCWAHKKWNKTASDIKLVFMFSTITVMHGPINIKLYMFRTVPLSIIRSFSLYTLQWYMSYRFADSLRAGSGWIRGTVRNMQSFIPK